MTNISCAMESTKPPHPINTFSMAGKILSKLFTNSHYRLIGSCAWLHGDWFPKISITASVEQFLPDLIITVSNKPEENPWLEARYLYENSTSRALYQKAYFAATGMSLGFGSGSAQITNQHINDERTRVVNVIGSPAGIYRFPFLSHSPETAFGLPYYLSELDAVMDRTEVAEILYMANHPNLLFNHNISIKKCIAKGFQDATRRKCSGAAECANKHMSSEASLQHSCNMKVEGDIWGTEIPRLMRVTQPYNFRASVVAAMRAADIVTNNHPLHVTKSTNNSCGQNCVVANAIFDPDKHKVIWQEIYPNNRNIKPGDSNDFGIEDDQKGNGNYVFVLWRKYRGCVQHPGKLLRFATFPNVGQPIKR
jgi:hypothetical protein